MNRQCCQVPTSSFLMKKRWRTSGAQAHRYQSWTGTKGRTAVLHLMLSESQTAFLQKATPSYLSISDTVCRADPSQAGALYVSLPAWGPQPALPHEESLAACPLASRHKKTSRGKKPSELNCSCFKKIQGARWFRNNPVQSLCGHHHLPPQGAQPPRSASGREGGSGRPLPGARAAAAGEQVRDMSRGSFLPGSPSPGSPPSVMLTGHAGSQQLGSRAPRSPEGEGILATGGRGSGHNGLTQAEQSGCPPPPGAAARGTPCRAPGPCGSQGQVLLEDSLEQHASLGALGIRNDTITRSCIFLSVTTHTQVKGVNVPFVPQLKFV